MMDTRGAFSAHTCPRCGAEIPATTHVWGSDRLAYCGQECATLEEIDDGDRRRWRFTAPSIGAAIVRVAMELETRCPDDCYPLHVSLKKSPRGARADATVIYQVKKRPLPVKRGGILLPRR